MTEIDSQNWSRSGVSAREQPPATGLNGSLRSRVLIDFLLSTVSLLPAIPLSTKRKLVDANGTDCSHELSQSQLLDLTTFVSNDEHVGYTGTNG